ncbi:PH domain-containing protein [Kitasatospora sp. NPDC048298]|uniref:PH domain-containing protein n=1 Tax=Kitasatospora sp. NPDC048298 TaxID=3364049 RepID=UPI003715AD2B
MNETIFRGRDLVRPAGVAMLFLVLTVEVAFGLFAMTDVGTVLLVSLTLAMTVPFLFSTLRSWTRVGADGITVNRGFGSGRTYPWQQIAWVEVRRYPAGDSFSYALRIHLADGRRRLLPGLAADKYHSAAEFMANADQVFDWWEQSTDPARRVAPRVRLRNKVSTTLVVGLLLSGLLAAVILTQLR